MYININELSKATGLSVSFIHKCNTAFPHIYSDYTERGDYNSWLYDDSSCIKIFSRVKEFKDQGLSIGRIRRNLEKELQYSDKTPIETLNTHTKSEKKYNKSEESPLDNPLVKKILEISDLRIQDNKEVYEKVISLTEENAVLRNELKLLPEGKSLHDLKQVILEHEQTNQNNIETLDKWKEYSEKLENELLLHKEIINSINEFINEINRKKHLYLFSKTNLLNRFKEILNTPPNT